MIMAPRSRLLAPLLAGVLVAVPTVGCTMPPTCFSHRTGWSFPISQKVRPHLTHGETGRRLYDRLIDGDREGTVAMLRADPSLMGLQVDYDQRGDRPDGQHGDLLTFAVTSCDTAMLSALLDAGLRPDGAERGRALEWALAADTPVMAEMLLSAGASPDPQKAGGRDVFAAVAADRNLGGAMMLIRHGLDQRWVDPMGRGHLETALAMEAFDIAAALVDAGAPLWRVSLGGHMGVHSLMEPRLVVDPSQDASHRRLVERARASGLSWPPPPAAEVMRHVLDRSWPSPALTQAGVVVTPEARAAISSQRQQ
ncbi:hypothetical protein ACMGDM_18960 [Sphingomonas sp. DT-51]|uniref:hypothetical protein n=1 Tax=Sphingomonas sp. DT-51 TaxID=3396165 RepID=UPI003F1A1761